ncbi:MAG TPA: outer membrane beta-barrel protein [Azospirillum sp.]|nr:outer membrane beta-barrel protein [Azospirillum sp.]
MKKTSLSILALASVATALTSLPASAQELERGETILQRRRPEVEQLGVRAGAFLILPRVEAGVAYDSNVFLTENNTEGDWLYVIRPSLDVRSDFANHALNFGVSGDFGRYSDFSNENFSDYRVDLGGRYDIARETAVSGSLFHRRLHEGRSDPDSTESGFVDPFQTGNFAEPVVYYASGGEAALTQDFNRIRVRLSALATNYDYKSVELFGGGEESLDDRDRWEYGTALRVGYDLGTGYQPFVQAAYTRTDYRRAADDRGRDRDSNGYEFDVGTTFELTGLLTGEIFAGYLTKRYGDPRIEDFSGLSVGGQLNWAVTQLTTISGRISRQIRETDVTLNDVEASNYTRTIVAAGVDHELLRNLLLNGRLQWRQDNFTGIDRTDNVYTASAGATYLINRYLYLTGGYTYETRKSNVSGFDYKDNLVFLRVGAQM